MLPDPSKHRLIVSTSGGKDSTAMALHLIERGHDIECVFLDTGWESVRTYRYLRNTLPQHIGPIKWVRAEVDLPPHLEPLALELEAELGHYSAMVRVCLRKGMFPSRQRRWCTQELKVFVMMDYLSGLDRSRVINCTGIRHEEGTAQNGRGNMDEWELMAEYGCWVWRPIIDWSFADVVAIHHRHNIHPNPLYLEGATRVGCFPCIHARKAEVKALAGEPVKVAVLARLEEIVADLAAKRTAAKGNEPPAWFMSREDTRRWVKCGQCGGAGCDGCDGRGKTRTKWAPAQKMWPIARALEWADGPSQHELFEPMPWERGCARWGLCDVPTAGDSDDRTSG